MIPVLLLLGAGPWVPLPHQPEGLPYPTEEWPQGEPESDVDGRALKELVEAAVKAPHPVLGQTRAVVVIHRGKLVLERYMAGFSEQTRLVSWSIAKSFTHALVGVAAQQGLLSADAAMGSPHWKAGDMRGRISWQTWLKMNDGQAYLEFDTRGLTFSDAPRKLFGPGRLDVAAYCAQLPLVNPVGKHWNYNSCGLVLVADALTRLVVSTARDAHDRRSQMLAWMRRWLFEPLGMRSVTPQFDPQGLYYGSALIYATARDFARLGLLYLRGGQWAGKQVLPPGWADFARTSDPGDDADEYGAGFWITEPDYRQWLPADAFRAQGFEGQLVMVVPSKDLVVVRLGHFGEVGHHFDELEEWMGRVVATFPDVRQ